MPKQPSSTSLVTKALTTDVLKRKNPLTVIGILFLTAALPILVAAVLYGVFVDSQASESITGETPLLLISEDPVIQPTICHEESCIPGAIILSIENTESLPIAVTPIIESPEGTPPGIEVLLGYDDLNKQAGQALLLKPGTGGYAAITFTDSYVRDPAQPPILNFSMYECADDANLDQNNYVIDAAECTYKDQVSVPIDWNGYHFRAFDYNRFALSGTYTQLNGSSLAIVDSMGKNFGPRSTEPLKLTETIIEPGFRSLIEISWIESESNQPAVLRLRMQERNKHWEIAKASFSHPSIDLPEMFISLYKNGAPKTPIYQPSGILASPGGNALISPYKDQQAGEHVLVLHDFQITDLRDQSEPIYQRADIDRNGSIDIIDFSYWIAHFDTEFPDTSSPYDLTLDKRAGIFDYSMMIEHMGKSVEYWQGRGDFD